MNKIYRWGSLKHVVRFSYAALCVLAGEVFAGGETLGSMSSLITQSFTNVTKLIVAGAYLAGMGFAISAILKFKQHKDNPQQTQIGQPIGLTFVSAALIFLPSILGITGNTIFTGGGTVGGPTGIVFTQS